MHSAPLRPAAVGRSHVRRPGRVSPTALTVAAFALVGLVIRLAVFARSLTIIDRLFVPDDTYYTLTIARSMAHGHGPTTDGSTLTSGFQPLLGFLMTPVFWLTDNADAALRVDLLLLVVADTATIVVLAWVAYRLAGRFAAIMAAGLWAISPVGIRMSLGGLETSLAILLEIALVAVWIWANDAPSPRRWAAVGAVAALAALARIDALLLVGLLVAVQYWRGPRRQLISAAAAFVVVAGPWWVWCTVALGTPVPTSGPAAHKLAPYPSFSKTTTSLAVGAVSGGPFQPWDWFRARVVDHPGVGVAVFWLVVAAFMVVAGAALLRRRRATAAEAAPSAWMIAATLPAFAACLLVFYAWYSVTFYFTRYLAPVAMVVALVVAAAAVRVVSRVRTRMLAVSFVAAILVVPTAAALGVDVHYLRVQRVSGGRLGTPGFYDAATGYREVAKRVVMVPPRLSVVGGWQSGALSYFAGDRLTVVNLDGVVNPDARAATGRRLPEYIRSRGITWFADFPYAVVGLVFEVSRLEPKPRFGEHTKFESVDATPAYYVVQIFWPRP
jgi:hypothetical protein